MGCGKPSAAARKGAPSTRASAPPLDVTAARKEQEGEEGACGAEGYRQHRDTVDLNGSDALNRHIEAHAILSAASEQASFARYVRLGVSEGPMGFSLSNGASHRCISCYAHRRDQGEGRRERVATN